MDRGKCDGVCQYLPGQRLCHSGQCRGFPEHGTDGSLRRGSRQIFALANRSIFKIIVLDMNMTSKTLRFGIIGLYHESNTFIPESTTFDHYRKSLFLMGEEVRFAVRFVPWERLRG